ncbi:ABC transporter substrate-binding protein [Gemmatimonadetes bacterium T265]|nr:ABC transporter substrate-binding protein [Gemmatimonadetes bacterium T265]
MRGRAEKGRAAALVRDLPRRSAALAAACIGACAQPARPADVAVVASGADLESPDPIVTVHPLSRQVQRHVLLVTLARYDAAFRPTPYYARRWRWAPDRRAVTLSLEPTLRWHDGVLTTAADAVFTFDLARDSAVGSPRRAELGALADARAVDDTTLVLRFTAPQPDFPRFVCELPLVPRHLLGIESRRALRRAGFETAPVGNGPFRFVERRAGARWTFARNDAFPAAMGGAPHLARLVVAVVDEPTTKFAGLITGELDVAGIAPTSAALLARDPVARVVSYPVAFSTGLVFNTGRLPFDDARVRQAVSAAIDRRRIVDVALAGYGTPSASAVPPDVPYALPVPDPRDPRRADSLLDAAGWTRGPDGVRRRAGHPLAVELLTVGSGDNAAEQLVQADLAARGVAVAIRPRELGAFLTAARARRKTFDLLLAGVPGDVGLTYLAAMFASAAAGGTLDYSGYHRPTLDAAFARASAAPDSAERAAAWTAVQRMLADSVPVAWLYHSRGVQGVARRLRGVTMDLRGELATVHDWTGDPTPPASR